MPNTRQWRQLNYQRNTGSMINRFSWSLYDMYYDRSFRIAFITFNGMNGPRSNLDVLLRFGIIEKVSLFLMILMVIAIY